MVGDHKEILKYLDIFDILVRHEVIIKVIITLPKYIWSEIIGQDSQFNHVVFILITKRYATFSHIWNRNIETIQL